MSEVLAQVKDNVLEANAEMFIVPNSPGRIYEFIESFQPGIQKFASELLENAGMKPADENTLLVQVWITSDDLETDNLRSHSGKFITERGDKQIISIPDGNCPAELLEGKKEGDVVDLIFHMDDIKVILHTRLNQTSYRYRSYGRFEECFDKVAALASPEK